MQKILAFFAAFTWTSLWFTPDQQGMRYFNSSAYEKAAEAFTDAQWLGAAWYRAGAFDNAAQAFARGKTAEANYNEGNARLMAGKYDAAIACYDRALAMRSDWRQAAENRAIAVARAALTEAKGGDMGDQRLGADKIVFDNKSKASDQTAEVESGARPSAREVQALWLRRVQTRPADFLRAKFAYQLAIREEAEQ